MASPLRLWINAETGRLLNSGTSFVTAEQPTFHVGDTLTLELHLVAGAGVAASPYEVPFPAGATTKVAIGSITGVPTSGQWRLSVDGTETADLAHNASASAIAAALNALSSVSTAGGVTVASLGGGFSITWNTVGTKPAILAGSDTLAPASYEAIIILQAGGVSTREIVFVELRQNPIALADTFTPIGAPSVSVTTVSAWNGTNKVIRCALTNSPKSGFWTLTLVGGSTVSYALRSDTTSADIRAALGTSAKDVTQTGYAQWDIALSDNLTASVSGTGLVASDAVIGNLSLSTSEAIAYVGTSESASATLEIMSDSGSTHATLAQVSCVVANDVVSPGAIVPVSAGTVLTESVANARFIRRDASQSPSSADLDIIWPNLGVTLGSADTVDAINNAASPSSGNPFVTLSALNAVLPNQSLNTTDNVTFNNIDVQTIGVGSNISLNADATIVMGGGAINLGSAGIVFSNATTQTTAFIPGDWYASSNPAGYITSSALTGYETTSHASSTYATISSLSSYLTISSASSTYALLSSFDQGVKTTDTPSFRGLTLVDGPFGASANIVFNSTHTLYDVDSGGSVTTGGGGTNITSNDYPAEIFLTINGTNYAVPARLA